MSEVILAGLAFISAVLAFQDDLRDRIGIQYTNVVLSAFGVLFGVVAVYLAVGARDRTDPGSTSTLIFPIALLLVVASAVAGGRAYAALKADEVRYGKPVDTVTTAWRATIDQPKNGDTVTQISELRGAVEGLAQRELWIGVKLVGPVGHPRFPGPSPQMFVQMVHITGPTWTEQLFLGTANLSDNGLVFDLLLIMATPDQNLIFQRIVDVSMSNPTVLPVVNSFALSQLRVAQTVRVARG